MKCSFCSELFLYFPLVPRALVCPGMRSCPHASGVSRVYVLCVNPVWVPSGSLSVSTTVLHTDPQEHQCLQPLLRLVLFQVPLVNITEACPGPVWTQAHGFYLGINLGAPITETLTVASLPPPMALKYLTHSGVRN